jgi:hypothetical protein
MNGLLDGFKTGYGLMDNHYRNEDAKDFRDQQYDDQKKRQVIQDGYTKTQSEQGTESHDANMANMGLQTQLNTKKLATYDADKERLDKTQNQTLANAELQGKFNQERLTAAQKQAKDKEIAEKGVQVTNILEAKRAGMEVDFNKYNQLTEELEGTQWGFLGNDIQRRSVRALGEDIKNGEITSETLQLLNNGGMPELKKSIGKPSRFGSPITDVVIASLEPTNETGDKFAIRLLVRDEAGNVYQSGVNEERDAGDSPLKELDADKVIQHLMAQNAILDEVEQSGILEAAGQHKAMQMQQGSKVPASVQKYQYLDNLLGREQFKQWLTTTKDKSPRQLQFEANKIANEAVSNDMSLYNASPEEKAQAVLRITQSLLTMPQELGQQQQQQPAADPFSAQPNNNDPLGLRF